MIKVVLDTSSMISAIGWKESKPRQILDKCLSREAILCISPSCLGELKEVLSREKFDFIDKDEKEELLSLLSSVAEIFVPTAHIDVCRDKKDNKFIELAVESKADYIVASDEDLLSLKKVGNVKILSPSESLELFDK